MELNELLRELAQESKGNGQEATRKAQGSEPETPYKTQLRFALQSLKELENHKKALDKCYHKQRDWDIGQIEQKMRVLKDRIRYLTRKVAEKEI